MTQQLEQGGTPFYFSARDGLKLHVRDYGRGVSNRLPLICLPGLSRNSRDFDVVARHFSTHAEAPRRVVAFDFRGRGLSAYDNDFEKYNILTEAEDVIAGLDALGIAHGVFLGTSRGGLVTMVMAALRPGAISGAIFNDIGPVIEGDGLTQIRLYLQRKSEPSSLQEARRMQQEIMKKTFTALDDDDWDREVWCRYRTIDGKLRPDHDPKLVKTLTTLDLEAPIPTMWPQFIGLRHAPFLVIRGENSSLLSMKTVETMLQRHPDASMVTAKGQGHAPLLHRPEMIEAIETHLKRF